MSIPAAVRNTVWNKYIGTDQKIGTCFCCRLEHISYSNFHCGHIISRKKGGNDHIDNLRPICQLCNGSMGTNNMFEFMKKFGFDMSHIKEINDMPSESDINTNPAIDNIVVDFGLDVIDRSSIQTRLNNSTIDGLKSILKQIGLITTGNKQVLVDRITDAIINNELLKNKLNNEEKEPGSVVEDYKSDTDHRLNNLTIEDLRCICEIHDISPIGDREILMIRILSLYDPTKVKDKIDQKLDSMDKKNKLRDLLLSMLVCHLTNICDQFKLSKSGKKEVLVDKILSLCTDPEKTQIITDIANKYRNRETGNALQFGHFANNFGDF